MNGRKATVTYKKIAQLAGVSPSTVSKVMAGSSEISKETAERVRRIMKEYGCDTARYYKSKNSGLEKIRIAVLVPEIISVYYAQQVSEIVRILDDKNIICNIFITGFDGRKSLSIMQHLAEEGMTDGILDISCLNTEEPLPLPAIQLSETGGNAADCVSINLKQGMLDTMQYLKELGHRKIGFIGEKNTLTKQKLFYETANALGIPIDDANVFLSHRRFEQIGMEAAAYFLENGMEPTALIAAYDEVAMGAIQVLRQAGLKIPEDISLIGINDIPFAEYASVPLTTIQMFQEEVCHIAIRILLDKIMHPDSHALQHVMVQSRLVKRETVCPPRTHSIGKTHHAGTKNESDNQ